MKASTLVSGKRGHVIAAVVGFAAAYAIFASFHSLEAANENQQLELAIANKLIRDKLRLHSRVDEAASSAVALGNTPPKEECCRLHQCACPASSVDSFATREAGPKPSRVC